MAQKDNIVLGIKILKPGSGTKEFIEKNIPNFITKDDDIVFPYVEDDTEIYDEFKDVPGQYSLVLIDGEHVYDEPELTSELADFWGLGVDELTLDTISDIFEFISNDKELIASKKKEISKSTAENETETVQLRESNLAVDIPTVTPTEKPVIEDFEDIQDDLDVDDFKVDDDLNIEDFSNDESLSNADGLSEETQVNVEEFQKQEESPQENHVPQGKIDPLLTLASEIFQNRADSTLPIFDEVTSKQLQPQIVKSEMKVFNARDTAIFQIYDVLKEHKVDIEKEFEENYSESRKEHEEQIKALNVNREDEIGKAKSNSAKKYQEAQDKFVREQEQALRDAYDAQHKQNNLDALNAEVNDISREIKQQIDAENQKYDKDYQTEQVKFIERRMKQLDFDEIFGNYKKIVSDENQALIEASQDFKDQVGILVAKVVKERDDYKQEAETERKARKVFEETASKQIDMEAKRQADELSMQARKDAEASLDEYNERHAKDQEVIAKLQKVNSELQDTIQSEREKNSVLANQNVELAQANTKKIMEAKEQEYPKREKRKDNTLNVVVMTILMVIALLGIGFGTFTWFNASKQANTPTTTVSSSSQTNRHYESGDTWQYKASDGKTYKVTMDGATTGSYIDNDGNTHKIQLQ